jgi:hypothetical protein
LVDEEGCIYSGEKFSFVLEYLVNQAGNNFAAYAVNCCSLKAV